MNSVIAGLIGVAVATGALFTASHWNSQPTFGAFSDPFKSAQLAASPQNNYILSTDGTSNSWIANSGGPGGGLTSYDAFTHPTAGQSATTSLMLFYGNASTTNLSVGQTATTSITGTGNILAVAGAVGTPAYSFAGDTNTGIYSGGADIVSLSGGGAGINWDGAAWYPSTASARNLGRTNNLWLSLYTNYATTTQGFDCFTNCKFGSTATSTFASNGSLTMPSGSLLTVPNASTTILSGTTLCISTDCRTSWPAAGGGTWPFTPTTNFGQNVQGTSTALWLQATPFSLFASSTSIFDNASSTQLTTTDAWITRIRNLTTNGVVKVSSSNGTLSSALLSNTDLPNPINKQINLNATNLLDSSGSSGTSGYALVSNVTNDYWAPFGTTTANSWTQLQTFNGAASTTLLSSYGPSYFGATATSSFSSNGSLTLPSGSTFTKTGVTDGCATWTSGILGTTGAACGGTGTFPFSPTTNFAQAANATTTALWMQGSPFSFFASSTAVFTNASSTLSTIASRLYVGSGGVFDFGAGDVTLTHSSNLLAVNGGDLAINGGTSLRWDNGSNNASVFAFNNGTSDTNDLWVTAFGSADFHLLTDTSYFNGKHGIASSTPFAQLSIGTGAASSSIAVAEYRYGKSGNEATSTSKVLDCRTANTIHWPIGTSATTLTLSGLIPGQVCKVIVENPNSGTAGTITWAAASGYILRWPGGTQPTQTTTTNKMDIWSFIATQASSTIVILGAQGANY